MLRALGFALAFGLALFLFIVAVDPWGSLPLHLPLARVPVSSNARYAHPMLARDARFDGAIIGTSTSRLLRPDQLNPLFGASFANLAMNDAHAYEQYRLLGVFLAAHPAARVVLIGLDVSWCVGPPMYSKLSPRPFPEWMYETARWRGYRDMFGLFPLQEAVAQSAVLLGLKKPPLGLDGYTRFTPPDGEYDAMRAARHLAQDGAFGTLGAGPVPATMQFPALAYLRDSLAAMAPQTHKVLWFTPYYVRYIGLGNPAEAEWAECKRRVAEMAGAVPNAVVLDFMRPSAITEDPTNYWDAHHYREAVAARLGAEMAASLHGAKPADGVMLAGPTTAE